MKTGTHDDHHLRSTLELHKAFLKYSLPFLLPIIPAYVPPSSVYALSPNFNFTHCIRESKKTQLTFSPPGSKTSSIPPSLTSKGPSPPRQPSAGPTSSKEPLKTHCSLFYCYLSSFPYTGLSNCGKDYSSNRPRIARTWTTITKSFILSCFRDLTTKRRRDYDRYHHNSRARLKSAPIYNLLYAIFIRAQSSEENGQKMLASSTAIEVLVLFCFNPMRWPPYVLISMVPGSLQSINV